MDSIDDFIYFQLAVSITLLGGWETAKLAVEAHFQLKFPSLPRSFGFPSAEELAPLPCVENLVENEAVRVLEESLAQMKMEKRESSTSSECESGYVSAHFFLNFVLKTNLLIQNILSEEGRKGQVVEDH